MIANISLRLLFAHWIAFLETLQQFFWNYTQQPLRLSTVFPELIEDSSTFSPFVHVPRIRDPSDYNNPVALSARICPVPTILQTPWTMKPFCSIDLSDYDLNDASSVESSSHSYVVPDIRVPVWRSAVPHEIKPQTSASASGGDDHVRTVMAPYGARGLSFCPVLVGIVYTQSLLHFYMLLMIPTFFHHWFEDVLGFESVNPTELLDCSRFLHTSLWMAPWYLLRHGVRKVVPWLYRHIRRLGHKSAHPPIPRIVLIRVDGEAVPVNFIEDHKTSANVGLWSNLELANLNMRNSLDPASDNGEPQDFMQSLIFDGETCITTELEALPTRTVSHQGEHQGGIAEPQDGIGLGPLASEFADDHSQLFVNRIPDEQLEIYPLLVDGTNEPLRSVKHDTLAHPIPRPHTFVATPSNVDERDEFEPMAFLETGVNDVQDSTDSPREREDSEQDVAFSPWSLVNGYGPDESETPSETMSATSSLDGSQDTQTLVKNVRFAIGDDESVANCWKVCSIAAHTDEYTCAWNLGSQLEDDGVTSLHIPVTPFDPPMDRQDATPPELVTKTILPVMPSEAQVEENDVVLAESLSPSLTGKPIVNLPSLVATREDIRFVEMVPVALIEDAATCSPLPMLSPITPAVVINMNCIIGAVGEQSLILLETVELDQGFPDAGHAFDWVGILDDEPAEREMLDINSSREDRSCLSSPSVEGSDSACSPIVDSEPPLREVRTRETVTSASTAVSEIGMPVTSTSIVITNISPSAAIEVPGTNRAEILNLYEIPRCHSIGEDVEISLRDELQGTEVSVPDATSTNIHLPAVSKSPKESSMGSQGDFVAAEKSDSTTITLAGQPVSRSITLATGLPTTESSGRILALSKDTCKEASPPAMISEEKTDELDHEKSCEADSIPWDHPSTISEPPPERMLSGSIHAPSKSLRIPRTNSHIDQTSVLYETPPFMTCSVSSVRSDARKGDTSMTTENTSKRRQDLFASIHAPQRMSEPNVQPSVSQLRDESGHDHRRFVTSPVVVPEKKLVTKPCPPNWTAMPEVVDAFRMFKQAPSENTLRRVSSIAESTNRGPMLRVVDQKGIATSSLNSTSATPNIQSRWTHGSGLLLVRDLVSSDPADFNLRTCTNLRTPKIHGMNTIPVQQVLLPGMLDIPRYALQHEITPYPVRVNVDFSSTAAELTGIQRPQSVLVPLNAEMGPTVGFRRWMAYRG